MLYLISYDLAAPKKDYPPLMAALKGGGAVRILYSEWLLSSEEDVSSVYSAIRSEGELDDDDRLFVTELAAAAAWDEGRLLATDEVVKKLFADARR